MPLVVMCGKPCSGKSTAAEAIRAHFQQLVDASDNNCSIKQVTVISLSHARNAAYQDAKEEKMTRGRLKTQVDRLLSPSHLVILDSLNYIKGFRYELYCIARSLSTPHCVVYCDTPVETAKKWNAERRARSTTATDQQENGEQLTKADDQSEQDESINAQHNPLTNDSYSDQLFDELTSRFEQPIGNNRWDKPLFVLHPASNALPLPLAEIGEAVCRTTNVAKPNAATQPQRMASTNFVHELDKITKEVIQAIISAQDTAMAGDSIVVPHTNEKVVLVRKVRAAEFRKLRRQFLQMAKMNPPTKSQIPSSFVAYINATLDS